MAPHNFHCKVSLDAYNNVATTTAKHAKSHWEGEVKKLRFVRAAIALFIVAASGSSAFAQIWPIPASQPGVQVLCTGNGILKDTQGKDAGCPAPDTFKPTWPWSDPIQAFTGRYLDSLYVADAQQTFRTGRAGSVIVMPSLNRVYMQLGHAVAAYSLDTFFTRLENREPLVRASQYPGNAAWRTTWHVEQWLGWDAHFYAENGGAGWITPTIDGQDRLVRFDVDDRGYVYMAYTVFGWGIAKDDFRKNGGVAGLMDPMFQDYPHPQFPPNQIVTVRSSTGQYFTFIGGAGAGSMEMFDTTDPRRPVKQRDFPIGFVEVGKSNTALGAVVNDGKIMIFNNDSLASASTAAFVGTPPSGVFQAITSDGTNFFAISRTGAFSLGITAFIKQANGGYTQQNYDTTSAVFDGRSVKYGDGYLTVTGWKGGADLRIFKLNGTVPSEVSTNDYFYKYYSGPPAGYARPPIAGPAGAVTTRFNGKLYLFVPAWGLGDVYQLKSEDVVAVSSQGAVGVVNPNADPRVGKEVFYGDRVAFVGAGTGQKTLTWNFGNPEATGDPNSTTSGVAQQVTHQYSGLTPSTLGGTRSVSATDTNGIVSTTTVGLKMPKARFGVSGSTKLLFTQPDASSSAPIVYGDTFFDGSDGDVDGHYAKWTLDGVVTNTQPYTFTGQHVLNVGTCGQRTLGFDAMYGPYSPTTFATVGPEFPVGIHNFTYTVRPFAAAIDAPTSDAANVTFKSISRSSSDVNILPASATALRYSWDLIDSANAVLVTGPSGNVSTAAAIPNWAVPRSQFTARNMRARLTIVSNVTIPGTCGNFTSHSAVTGALNGPDPKINGDCTAGGPPCAFSAASVSGVNMTADGWSFLWDVSGPDAVSAISSNTSSFAPTFKSIGLYTVSLTVSNAIGTQTVTKQVNVTKAGSSCADMTANNVFIHFTGPSSSCTENVPNCSINDNLPFSIASFGYDFACGTHTYAWSFGDNTTGSGKNVTHKYSANGSYPVTCTISNGGQTFVASLTVKVGNVVTPPPTLPPPTTPPPTTPPPTTPPPVTPTGCDPLTNSSVFVGWNGQTTGCNQNNNTPCSTSEIVTLTLLGFNYNFACANHIYTWSFGDQSGNGQGKSVNHQFTKTGQLTLTCTVNNGSQVFPATAVMNVTGNTTTPPPVTPPVIPPQGCGTMTASNVFFDWRDTSNTCNAFSGTCPVNDILQFTAKSFTGYDFGCGNHTFQWDFGDGGSGSGVNANHAYTSAKTYDVKLTINNGNQTFIVNQQVKVGTGGGTVNPGGQLPDLSFDVDAVEPLVNTYNFHPNVNPSTGIVKWTWDFGDGQKITATSGGDQIHKYSEFQVYTVTLTIENSAGPVKTYSKEVIAQPPHRRAKR